MSRGLMINVQTQLVTEECCNCHVVFAFPAELKTLCLERRGPNGRQFYCPNGHGQHYSGESEAERLRHELQAERDRHTNLIARLDQVIAEKHELGREARKLKRERNATMRRITNGVCPCCQRTFKDIARHMQSRHPHEVVTADHTQTS